jgi:hypothetical protein
LAREKASIAAAQAHTPYRGEASASHSATGPKPDVSLRLRFYACSNGQKLKCLTIVDEWTRERSPSMLPAAFAPSA